MARINFDDDVEKQEEFWLLLDLVGGDRDGALGKLIRFFRLAQKKYGHDEPLLAEDLEKVGLVVMIQSGWAVEIEGLPGRFQAKGAEKEFAWYRQRVFAGGARSDVERDEKGRFKPSGTVTEPERDGNGSPAAHQPPSLALAPSPAPVQKKEESICVSEPAAPPRGPDWAEPVSKDDIETSKHYWFKTLAHFGQPRDFLLTGEDRKIWEACKRYPLTEVCHAISGMRFEPPTPSFDPKRNVNLARAFDPKLMTKFIGLSLSEQAKRLKARPQGPGPVPIGQAFASKVEQKSGVAG